MGAQDGVDPRPQVVDRRRQRQPGDGDHSQQRGKAEERQEQELDQPQGLAGAPTGPDDPQPRPAEQRPP